MNDNPQQPRREIPIRLGGFSGVIFRPSTTSPCLLHIERKFSCGAHMGPVVAPPAPPVAGEENKSGDPPPPPIPHRNRGESWHADAYHLLYVCPGGPPAPECIACRSTAWECPVTAWWRDALATWQNERFYGGQGTPVSWHNNIPPVSLHVNTLPLRWCVLCFILTFGCSQAEDVQRICLCKCSAFVSANAVQMYEIVLQFWGADNAKLMLFDPNVPEQWLWF